MKRKGISLELKKKIIDEADNGVKNCQLSTKFNLPDSTISDILKAKHKTITTIENGGSAKRIRIKKESSLDEAVLTFFI